MTTHPPPAAVDLELFHFWFSHFNEKARWGLDLAGLSHRSTRLVPGMHLLAGWRRTGQTATPYLRVGRDYVVGSDAILRHVHAAAPGLGLWPDDPTQQARVDDWNRWFDDVLGPAVRRRFFFELMPHRRYFTAVMTDGAGPLRRLFYRATVPAVQWVMRRDMDVYQGPADAALKVIEEGLGRVAALGGGYAVGDRFTAADLTAAALLYPMAGPPEGPQFIEPRPAEVDAWFARWAGHPGVSWVRRIFADHRPVAAA